MKLEVLIETGEKCGFNLKDITPIGENGYLPTESDYSNYNNFKYEDSIGIAVVQHYKSNGEELLHSYKYIPHNEDQQFIEIPTNFDGYFKLCYIVLPTKQFVDTLDNLEDLTWYYSDGIKLYKKSSNTIEQEIQLQEILNINIYNTTISKFEDTLMSICNLKKCFIIQCTKILESKIFTKCAYKNKVDENLIFNRDLLWMFINTISYLVEFGQFLEAQRLLELIQSCNGICKSNHRESNSNGCGCS